jgi:hypothetical protein
MSEQNLNDVDNVKDSNYWEHKYNDLFQQHTKLQDGTLHFRETLIFHIENNKRANRRNYGLKEKCNFLKQCLYLSIFLLILSLIFILLMK